MILKLKRNMSGLGGLVLDIKFILFRLSHCKNIEIEPEAPTKTSTTLNK